MTRPVSQKTEDALRAALSKVHRAYAGRIHAREQRTGHFWQGRQRRRQVHQGRPHRQGRQKQGGKIIAQMGQAGAHHAIAQVGIDRQGQMRAMLFGGRQGQDRNDARQGQGREVGGFQIGPETLGHKGFGHARILMESTAAGKESAGCKVLSHE